MTRCLVCYQKTDDVHAIYHEQCARDVFRVPWIPTIAIDHANIHQSAVAMAGHMSISGAQPKVSACLDRTHRLLVLAQHSGEFILKPPSTFPKIPENEALCMQLAKLAQIAVPPSGLIKTTDNTLVYLVRRFDLLAEQKKLHVEDFAQIMNVPSAPSYLKYEGSYETLARSIQSNCTNTTLELLVFFERLLFAFLIGNGDMHLKNFSIIYQENGDLRLSPAYDLLSTKLVIPKESDMALHMNGKKNKLTRVDFEIFGHNIGLAQKTIQITLNSFEKLHDPFAKLVKESFLPKSMVGDFLNILEDRFRRIETSTHPH